MVNKKITKKELKNKNKKPNKTQKEPIKRGYSVITRKFETWLITLTILIFFIGYIAGWYFSDNSLTDLEIEFGQTQLDLNSISQRFMFAKVFENTTMCNSNLFNDILGKLYNSRIELTRLENENKIKTDHYQYLKQRHNLNQVYFYSEYKPFFDNCNNSQNIILFFFTEDNPEAAQKQGEELDKLFQNRTDIIVLPMDYNHTQAIDYFYKYYDIKQLPALIVNYNKTFEGFTTYNKIQETLK